MTQGGQPDRRNPARHRGRRGREGRADRRACRSWRSGSTSPRPRAIGLSIVGRAGCDRHGDRRPRSRRRLRGRPAFPIVVRLTDAVRDDLEALKNLPVPLPAERRTDGRLRVLLKQVATLRVDARGRTRSAARTASGASSSPPTCAGATSARWSPRRRRRSRRAGQAAAGLLDHLGRPVREPRRGASSG